MASVTPHIELSDSDSDDETETFPNPINTMIIPLEAPTRTDLSPIHTALNQLHNDIGITKLALSKFIGAQFEEARSIVQPLADSKRSLYGSLGMGVLLMLRAMLTFAPEDISAAQENLDAAINIATRMKRGMSANTIYSRMMRIFSRNNKDDPTEASFKNDLFLDLDSASKQQEMSEDEVDQIMKHAELVSAEAYLLRAIVLIATDYSGSWILFMRESLNIRSSYIVYHNAFNELATASANEIPDMHYESGILLGNGILNVLLSLLPPRVFQFFSYLGYKGSISMGISQLRAAAACSEGLRAPMAELGLLFYYTVLSDSIAIGRDAVDGEEDDGKEKWTGIVQNILDKRLQEYPTSPIYLYYLGRFKTLLNKTDEAATILEQTMAMRSSLEWPQLLHACAWELLVVSMFQLDWKRAYELASLLSRESKWSLCFSTFLEAIFLSASVYLEDPQPETREKIQKLIEQVPLHVKRIAGKRLPIEKFAVRRAQEMINTGELPFYPEYELLLVWDGFSHMDSIHLETVMERMHTAELERGTRQDQYFMILLVQAAVLRVQTKYTEAMEKLTQVLNNATLLPNDFYAIPVAHLELAQIHLSQKNFTIAKDHYDLCTSYPCRYILQRSVHLRQAKVKAELARFFGS